MMAILIKLTTLLKNLITFPGMSIRGKLIIYFVIISSVPLLLLGISSYYKSTKLVNDQFGRYGEHSIEQMTLLIDEHLQQMNIIASNVIAYLSNPATMPLTGYAAADYSDLQNEKEFLKVINLGNHSFPSIVSAGIITPTGKIYGSNLLQLDNLINSHWWNSIDHHNNKRYWSEIHTSDYYNPFTVTPTQIISLIIPLDKTYKVPDGSRLLVDVKAGPMLDIFHAFERDTGAYIEIIDSNGNRIYESDGSFILNESDIIWVNTINTTGWTIHARLPFHIFNQSSNIILQNTITFIVLSFVIAFGLAFLFSSIISKRLKLLNQSMLEFGLGRMTTKLKVDAVDEIGQLEKRFNVMTEQIRMLMHDIESKEQLKKEAELKALHYQINPHLLFNTINSIQWKARLSGDEEIPAMLYHLTELLADSLNITDSLIQISQELNIIQHYLEIQRYRYGNVFTYQLTMDDGINHFLIPRMSLQPLIENIFFHAFIDGNGHIQLDITRSNQHLVLKLQDDGDGLPATGRLNHTTQTGRRGLGIRNVDEKFKLHFGETYGLQLQSDPGKGTLVMIRWPVREKNLKGKPYE